MHTHEGPPPDYQQGDLDADFYQIPYGLLSLAALSKALGAEPTVLNLSSYAWSRVQEIVATLHADVWGVSVWTAGRRGALYLVEEIRRVHPNAKIVLGGPHATALPKELMERATAVDAVCVGESEGTWEELLARLARGESWAGVPGAFTRDLQGCVVIGNERPSIDNLDCLPSVHAQFATTILMTSRGCPWACTFCGAENSWGRSFRSHSVGYVLDSIASALKHLPTAMIQIKDDTFTTNKKRVVALCEGIAERKLNFVWSCDTRVDVLDAALLRVMRKAGCQRISLGVESGSQRVLDAMDKKITVDEIIRTTKAAREVGIRVRYYMMVGSRGEDWSAFQETLAFLKRAQPHEYLFSCMSIYPGTHDYEKAEREGWVTASRYFDEPFQELKVPMDASEEDAAKMNQWFTENSGLQRGTPMSLEEAERALVVVGPHPLIYADLAQAHAGLGRWQDALACLEQAEAFGHPLPGLLLNARAVIAKEKGDFDAMMDLFTQAAKRGPQHWVLIQNVNRTRAWFAQQGPARGLPLDLEIRMDFQLLEKTLQPMLPGPVDGAKLAASHASPLTRSMGEIIKSPLTEGSRRPMGRRLAVVPSGH